MCGPEGRREAWGRPLAAGERGGVPGAGLTACPPPAGQDQGPRPAGEEEGGAAEAVGRSEGGTVAASRGQGDWRGRLQALQDVSGARRGPRRGGTAGGCGGAWPSLSRRAGAAASAGGVWERSLCESERRFYSRCGCLVL